MHEYRPQHYSNHSAIATPKDPHSNFSSSYIQVSPTLKLKSKGSKETVVVERPKSNKSRHAGIFLCASLFLSLLVEQSGTSHKQLEISSGTMQRLLMERNSNNLYGTFYNSVSKTRDREKTGLASMLKLRDGQREVPKDNHRDSPAKRQLKYTTSRGDRLIDEKALMIDLAATKSYRKDDSRSHLQDQTHRPTSRQKGAIYGERSEQLNKSALTANVSPQKIQDISPERYKVRNNVNASDPYVNSTDQKSKRLHKPIDADTDRHSQASGLHYSRVSPHKQLESSYKLFEFVPADTSKGYKSAYRPQQDADHQAQSISIERKDSTTSRKQHRRGISIDQAIQYVAERPQSSRRDKGRKTSREEQAFIAPNVSERRMTPQKNDSYYQQQQLQMQLQQQQQQQLLLQQQQLQMQLQQQQQQKLQEQQQQQQQQIIVINNEQDQVKYFEKLLHIDKVTFEFEKLMIMRRYKKQSSQNTPVSTTAATKPSMHTRTRSMEEPGSLVYTKSSSRWNTKRSDGQNLGDDTAEMAEGHVLEKVY